MAMLIMIKAGGVVTWTNPERAKTSAIAAVHSRGAALDATSAWWGVAE